MNGFTLLSGALVGFSLGLTGGGGAIFAVPLLVYGLGLPPREAVGVSLLTVAITSLVGLVQRARHGQVEYPTGLLFALAGMVGTPLGAWLAEQLSPPLLLLLFAVVMLIVAARMWLKAGDRAAQLPLLDDDSGPTCRRDPAGQLRLTSPCALLLGGVGLGAGVLAGLFGVGGGFIIVPALVLLSGMGMQRAIGTSLLVLTLVAATGVANFFLQGKSFSPDVALWFSLGGIVGLFGGVRLSRRLAGPVLQRTFAAAMVGVAAWMIVKNFGT